MMQPRSSRMSTANVVFNIGGNRIEIVDQWPHLGHMIKNRRDDDADIMNRCIIMVGKDYRIGSLSIFCTRKG